MHRTQADSKANTRIMARQMFRLLPAQVFLMAIGSVNGLVSVFFANNYVGMNAMGAVGLYFPVTLFMTALSIMMVGGSAILCGRYMGGDQRDHLNNIFSLDLIVCAAAAGIVSAGTLLFGVCGLSYLLTADPQVRAYLDQYIMGQSLGLIPLLLGSQLSSFLSMENRGRRCIFASVTCIAVTVALNIVFVKMLRMEALGLALASSLGMWVYFLVQAQHFVTSRTGFRFRARGLRFSEIGDIVRIGYAGALSQGYQAIRAFLLNKLIDVYVGAAGLSAFATLNNLLSIVWALPVGMLAVSRMLMSISIGEEDRQSLADVMRVMFTRYMAVMTAVAVAIVLCAAPLTSIFYHDPAEPAYAMAVSGFRIIPFCMPLSLVVIHFVCYGQISGKNFLVQILSLLDGVICLVVYTVALISVLGMNSVYMANILNGMTCCVVILLYSWIRNRHFPKNMYDLMVVPEDFGFAEEERMDLSIRSIEEVVEISRKVQEYCLNRGIDERRSYISGLALEEMAGNIVEHGFTKDRKTHSIDVRVVHRGDDVILRLKDDCVAFDPNTRRQIAAGDADDRTRNMGIRMIFDIAESVQYQNLLGLNTLTIRV